MGERPPRRAGESAPPALRGRGEEPGVLRLALPLPRGRPDVGHLGAGVRLLACDREAPARGAGRPRTVRHLRPRRGGGLRHRSEDRRDALRRGPLRPRRALGPLRHPCPRRPRGRGADAAGLRQRQALPARRARPREGTPRPAGAARPRRADGRGRAAAPRRDRAVRQEGPAEGMAHGRRPAHPGADAVQGGDRLGVGGPGVVHSAQARSSAGECRSARKSWCRGRPTPSSMPDT